MSLYTTHSKSSTPLSILKKTPSLKNRLSQLNTPSKVRFSLPYSKKIKSILYNYIENDQLKEYENLVILIRDAELLDDDINSLLEEISECIRLLNKDLRLLVEALLSINWIQRNSTITKQYQTFIVNLVSAHNYHAEFIIEKLISLFLPSDTESEWIDGIPDDDIKKCKPVHSLLKILLKIVPLCKGLLLNAIVSKFPFLKKSTHIHEFFLYNVLKILTYQPTLRYDIMCLIFSKLVIMDVHAPKEDIEQLNDEMDTFPMDDCVSIKSYKSINVHQIAHTLDVCLNMMFNYISEECFDNKELDWNKTKDIYQEILKIFDNIILPTHNCHHVQFVMFFLCSFKTTLSESYLSYLWKKVCKPNVPSILRQSSVNYLVSIVARATFITLTTVKYVLKQMSDWIHSYIAQQDGLEYINSDVRIHSVFYTVCQALFYVVSFRHKEFVKNRKSISFLESLNLAKIVTCRLNPLKFCQMAVVQNFAAITRKYQLAYCYSVIEHNSRNTLPTIYRDEKGSILMSESVLAAYYPFDPYILEISGSKINKHYRNFQEFNNKRSYIDGDIEDDDFLNYSTEGKNAKFSYGTSPGFKCKT